MGHIGLSVGIFVCMAPFSLMGLVFGYQVGIKYDYHSYSNYYKKKERYPIEIEKKYLRHTGIPILINALYMLVWPFTIGYSWNMEIFSVVMVVTMVYPLVVPKFIAEKELKKLN